MVRFAIGISVVGVIFLVVGCPGTMPPDSGNGGTTGNAVAGATLYSDSCMVCHGDGASGGNGPDIRAAEAAEISDHVIDGHEGHTIIDLSEQDIADIEAYLSTL